ncbi:MAG TPA: DNA-directed RNA polymerase subunit K [Thermoplasmata archaeon]|nr:DNA-directed RNA polymerase subunit K [Thermoplasmata archaeon]
MTAAGVPAAAGVAVSSGALEPAPPDEPTLTRFERARILGARALQISLGAPILIDVSAQLVDPVEIAEREYAAGVIPITVRRGLAR